MPALRAGDCLIFCIRLNHGENRIFAITSVYLPYRSVFFLASTDPSDSLDGCLSLRPAGRRAGSDRKTDAERRFASRTLHNIVRASLATIIACRRLDRTMDDRFLSDCLKRGGIRENEMFLTAWQRRMRVSLIVS